MPAERLQPEHLRRRCDPETLPFATTDELEPLEGMIGQERAVRAVEFGLRVRMPGHNVYLSGPVGTGKTTYALGAARREAARWPIPDDWVYLHHFDDPETPLAVNLPAGQGRRLREALAEFVDDLQAALPRLFASDAFAHQRQLLLRRHQQRVEEEMEALEREVEARGFALRRTPTGFGVVPLGEGGEPLAPEQLAALPPAARDDLERRAREIHLQLAEALHRAGQVEREARDALRALERQAAAVIVRPLVERLRGAFGGHPVLRAWLDGLERDVLEHLDDFRPERDGEDEEAAPLRRRARSDRLRRYRVNLLVDHAHAAGAPVVHETNPTYYNLVGRVEYVSELGTLTTDFTLIRPGALHRANGGVLVLPVRPLLASPGAWEALKRALRTSAIDIESPLEQVRALPTRSLRPQPIPLHVKVLLVGTPEVFRLLEAHDEDFPKLFKVKADFDTSMPRTDGHVLAYARFVAGLTRREGLPPFEREAVARVVEHAARLAEDQARVSTRFNAVADVVIEASAWATLEGARTVTAAHVARALREQRFRVDRLEERLRELVRRGTILVDLSGEAVGQVNGLAVLRADGYAFGRPARITARTYLGEEGVVQIEREVELSGEVHDKGVLTLVGYLGGRYAQERPLALSASLAFEQQYEPIDGDSASSAELYALLSSLAGVPLRQDLAVTGSVNQRGEIQPVGGINEKIEGFYRVCRVVGLTGTQGVIIPARNVEHLMLDEEVVEAAAAGGFHIYAVRDVDEGIELLTGLPASEVHARVAARLQAYADVMARFGSTRNRDGSR